MLKTVTLSVFNILQQMLKICAQKVKRNKKLKESKKERTREGMA